VPVDGKLMQLRATQMNLLRLRGIDFKTVLGIYGKYEKGIPVPPEETALYEHAIGILVQNNAADSYLSQYSKKAKAESAAKKSTGRTGPQATAERERPPGRPPTQKTPLSAKTKSPGIKINIRMGKTTRNIIFALFAILLIALTWMASSGGKKAPRPKSPTQTAAQKPVPGKPPQK
jgi:hypothetical protein